MLNCAAADQDEAEAEQRQLVVVVRGVDAADGGEAAAARLVDEHLHQVEA